MPSAAVVSLSGAIRIPIGTPGWAPLLDGGRSAMCGFGFGEKPLDALLGSAEVLRPFSDRNNVLHALRDPAHSTTLP